MPEGIDLDGGHVATIIAAIITGVLTYLGTRAMLQAQIASKEHETGPTWYRELRDDITDLQKQVATLNEKVGLLTTWKRAASWFIHRAIEQVPAHLLPKIPHEIADDFPEPRGDPDDDT